MYLKTPLVFIFIILSLYHTQAQQLKGSVSDAANKQPLAGVEIINIYNKAVTHSDSNGAFTIAVEKGQLVSFNLDGYVTERMRIPKGSIPPYIAVFLTQKAISPAEQEYLATQKKAKDWKSDSLRYTKLYSQALSVPKFTALDYIQHPFSAMSKKNREAWAFQEEFSMFQKQKFVEYKFNEKLIEDITGLAGDSATVYVNQFRPGYEQLRDMGEYDLYLYISQTVYFFRTGINPRHAIRRSTR